MAESWPSSDNSPEDICYNIYTHMQYNEYTTTLPCSPALSMGICWHQALLIIILD